MKTLPHALLNMKLRTRSISRRQKRLNAVMISCSFCSKGRRAKS